MKPAAASVSGLLVSVALFTLGCAATPHDEGVPTREGRPNSDTIAYFRALSDQGMGAAQAMASASDLENIKGALIAAKFGETLEYQKYSRSRVTAGNGGNGREIAAKFSGLRRRKMGPIPPTRSFSRICSLRSRERAAPVARRRHIYRLSRPGQLSVGFLSAWSTTKTSIGPFFEVSFSPS
jgi:hypothetical protein